MRVEVDNPMLLPFRYEYQEPTKLDYLSCDYCDKEAVYYVNESPHCKDCVHDAIDSPVDVKVRVI